ncbi:MAG: response regulator transcription factor, partial [Limnohabitans sp.]
MPAHTQQHPIQLIEDDAALAQSLLMLLSAANFTCVHYKSAEDFLASVKANSQALGLPTCVISDIRLPGMTGIEMMASLKKEHPNCVWPVILITGHADVAMAVDAMHMGAFDFLAKPFDPFMLPKKLSAAIEKSQQLKAGQDFVQTYEHRLTSLSEQERKIFGMILENQTSREIAETLGNSTRTIEVHRAAIFKKMEAASILDLAKH